MHSILHFARVDPSFCLPHHVQPTIYRLAYTHDAVVTFPISGDVERIGALQVVRKL